MTAGAGVVSQVDVSRTGKTKVQTGLGVGGTKVGVNGNARTVVVSEVEEGKTDMTELHSNWVRSGWIK